MRDHTALCSGTSTICGVYLPYTVTMSRRLNRDLPPGLNPAARAAIEWLPRKMGSPDAPGHIESFQPVATAAATSLVSTATPIGTPAVPPSFSAVMAYAAGRSAILTVNPRAAAQMLCTAFDGSVARSKPRAVQASDGVRRRAHPIDEIGQAIF